MNPPTDQEIRTALWLAGADLTNAHRRCDQSAVEAAHKRRRDIEDACDLINLGHRFRASARGLRKLSDAPHPEGAERRDRLRAEAVADDAEAVAYFTRARHLLGLS